VDAYNVAGEHFPTAFTISQSTSADSSPSVQVLTDLENLSPGIPRRKMAVMVLWSKLDPEVIFFGHGEAEARLSLAVRRLPANGSALDTKSTSSRRRSGMGMVICESRLRLLEPRT
jgi:hypothetical protein